MADSVPAGSDVSAGTYQCTECGYCLDVQSTKHLPPCPQCSDITQVPVLSFIPQPTHPSTGDCWAEVMYFSGRTELPLAAVISFTPDPTVRERWNTAIAPPSP
jgi:hypothetical protein